MRKPRDYTGYGPDSRCYRGLEIMRPRVFVSGYQMKVKSLRAFAAWLLKAADWLEEKEGEK